MNEMLPILFPLTPELPYFLAGAEGSNRAPIEHCQIAALNDFEAVQTWLKEYESSPATYRVYQKEAERLLLWCVYQHKKALSSLKRDDFENYIAFLRNPQPRDKWCGTKGGRGQVRGSKNWKPFTSPLSAKSLNTSLIFPHFNRHTYLLNYESNKEVSHGKIGKKIHSGI